MAQEGAYRCSALMLLSGNAAHKYSKLALHSFKNKTSYSHSKKWVTLTWTCLHLWATHKTVTQSSSYYNGFQGFQYLLQYLVKCLWGYTVQVNDSIYLHRGVSGTVVLKPVKAYQIKKTLFFYRKIAILLILYTRFLYTDLLHPNRKDKLLKCKKC